MPDRGKEAKEGEAKAVSLHAKFSTCLGVEKFEKALSKKAVISLVEQRP